MEAIQRHLKISGHIHYTYILFSYILHYHSCFALLSLPKLKDDYIFTRLDAESVSREQLVMVVVVVTATSSEQVPLFIDPS